MLYTLGSGYKPELETSADLNSDGVQYYQELIRVLRWTVELGRVDILLEVALMSTYMAMPREGHLQQLYRIFGYLKLYPKRKIAFDPQHPAVNERMFRKCDWTDFYHDVKEAIPGDTPVPRGNPVLSQAACGTMKATCGIIVEPMMWYLNILCCQSAMRLFCLLCLLTVPHNGTLSMPTKSKR